MAQIEDTLAPHFTGHVGPVRFVNGRGATEDPELLEFFRSQSERYAVEQDTPAADPKHDDEGDDPDEE